MQTPPGIIRSKIGEANVEIFSWAYDVERKHPQREPLPGDKENSREIRAYHAKVLSYVMQRVIKDIGVQSVKRCPECGKIFFHATKRKKDHCSLSCQNTRNVATWRSNKTKEDNNGSNS